jgi:arylsulfatase
MLAATASARDKPNVVIMLADNLGYGDLGAYGAGEVRGMPTPRIDQFASESLRLTHFLVEPGCTPSRAALQTGRYSPRSGGPYGDAIMELDYRTGQVLDAIEAAGVEGDTIVIWLSDNGATPTEGPAQDRGGSNGPFRGELGDGLEGSLRVPGMIKWPGKIAPRVSNEMVSIHDFFPTLARVIGAPTPTDRPIDGVDQSAFFTGQQTNSNRDSLLTFIGDELVAVRWRQFRIYPKQFISSAGNPSMAGAAGYRAELVGYPSIFNIEQDPREEVNITATSGWVLRPYMELIGAYQQSLEQHPNPPAVNLTKFSPR